MADNLHTLHLEPYDDAVSVRDRLASVYTPFVLLVWPPTGPVLRRKLDLLLVQRQATRLGQRIALVTRDPVVIDHAGDLNISVFPDEQAALRGRWKRPRYKVFAPPSDPTRQVDLAARILQQRSQPPTPTARRWRQALRWMAFAALLCAPITGFFIAAPSATVTLTPASDQVFVRVPITADPNATDIDIEADRIPAAVVPLEATAHVTVRSSGRKSGGMSQAQGLVTFTNMGDTPLLIPLGTVVATSDTYPIRFATQLEVLLPAGPGAAVDAPIQALIEYSGPAGNVGPGTINRVESDFAGQVTLTNPNATFGGAVQEVSLVTADDHARLLTLGRQQVLQHARDDLLHRLTGEQFLVPGSLQIIEERPEWTIYNAFVGDSAESVSLDLRARVRAVVVDGQQAEQVAYSGLAPYIRPGQEVPPASLRFTRGDIQQIEPDGRVVFLMIVEGNVAVSINENAVRDRLAGVSVTKALNRLQSEWLLDPDRPPQITTWPGWYRRLPVLPVRITVRVQSP